MNLVSTMLLGRVQERAASAIGRIECVEPRTDYSGNWRPRNY